MVDWNHVQLDGTTEEIMDNLDVREKWRSFGWNVIECDGHSVGEVLNAYQAAAAHKGAPSVIVAHTVKGKGVSFMEGKAAWHGVAPNAEQLAEALREING